jgi:hypothetical protein
VTSANLIAGASLWYLLDITSQVASNIAAGRQATVFDVEFRFTRSGALKKAQITAQIAQDEHSGDLCILVES